MKAFRVAPRALALNLFVLGLALLPLARSVWAQDELPDNVYLKNHEQSFSSENYYALKDGKLWVKPNELVTHQKGEWTLFQGTGVPCGKAIKSFEANDRLVAFSTEALMVAALSNKGRFYFWDPTQKGKPDQWFEKKGAPFEGALYLPPSRDWAFSLSMADSPYKRKAPMKDLDTYFTDGAGNKVNFGFTATVFTLDPDGQRIRFWDTGLPASFHKAFATPEQGRFVAERLATSGSTIFVIDKSGKMYTRMYDYELFGACPGLQFTFQLLKQDYRDPANPDESALYDPVRVLPLSGWKEQKFNIPLTGQAELTTGISIHITGKGDDARELRVSGRDAAGNYGYYSKPIANEEWTFTPTTEHYEPAIAVNPAAPRELGRIQAHTYGGKIEQSGTPALDVDLVDFYYFDSPTALRVKLGDGRTIDLRLHTFDAWSPTTQQKAHPAMVGSIFGEPKLLVGTLEIPKEILDSTDPAIKSVIDAYFRRFNLVHGAFAISADDGKVNILTRRVQRNSAGYLDYSYRKRLKLSFQREVSREDLAASGVLDLKGLASTGALELKEPDKLGAKDILAIDEAIARNEATLKELKSQTWSGRWDHLKNGLFAGTAYSVFEVVNAFTSVTNITGHSRLWRNLSLTGGGNFKEYAKMNLKAVFTNPADYGAAVSLLKQRISDYKTLRAKLTSNHCESCLLH